ncbi:MAG: inorganic diphosphatase [Candidatus Sulfotelmatobacter sp.]
MTSYSWHDITAGEHLPKEFNAVVEIPLGSSVKYELDKKTGSIRIDRFSTRPFTTLRIMDPFPRRWPA